MDKTLAVGALVFLASAYAQFLYDIFRYHKAKGAAQGDVPFAVEKREAAAA